MGTGYVASSLQQIQNTSSRAVLGGILLIICCLIAANLLKTNVTARYIIFLTLISGIGITSGIVLAAAYYTVQDTLVVGL